MTDRHDEAMRDLHRYMTVKDGNIANALDELLARRAEEAAQPFKRGDLVTVSGGVWNGVWSVVGGTMLRVSDRNGFTIIVPAADLTPVPPKRTAAEIFAEELTPMLDSRRRAADCTTLTIVGNLSEAAFRAFCAKAGIDPDAPLPDVTAERSE